MAQSTNHFLKILRGAGWPALMIIFLFLDVSLQAQNVERELEMGEESKKQLEQQIGFYEHPAQEYLTSLGLSLVDNLEDRVFDYRFGIIDMKEPNALAVPGGDVYFSRGILLLANSEQELAGVMGHEIIHVYKSHSRKASNRSIFSGILKLPGAIVGVFAPTAGSILMAPGAMFDAGYSRKNEKQSDELGAQLAAKTGFDPEGLVTILEKMSEMVEMETGMEEQRSFYSTHPYTPKRLDDLNKTIRKIDFDPDDSRQMPKEDFLQKLEGIIIGDNPAHGVFNESKFLHPELNIAFEYPADWEGINTPMFVGFLSPDQNSQFVVTLNDTTKSPATYAREIERDYYRNYGYEADQSESLVINDNPAYILSYEGYTEDGKVVLSFLWLKWTNFTYSFISMGMERYKDVPLRAAKSLHALSKNERQNIEQTVLKVVQALPDESLANLSKRTSNVLELNFLELINDLKPGEPLVAGQWIKIGVREPY